MIIFFARVVREELERHCWIQDGLDVRVHVKNRNKGGIRGNLLVFA
jgi:hypothetical protein